MLFEDIFPIFTFFQKNRNTLWKHFLAFHFFPKSAVTFENISQFFTFFHKKHKRSLKTFFRFLLFSQKNRNAFCGHFSDFYFIPQKNGPKDHFSLKSPANDVFTSKKVWPRNIN